MPFATSPSRVVRTTVVLMTRSGCASLRAAVTSPAEQGASASARWARMRLTSVGACRPRPPAPPASSGAADSASPCGRGRLLLRDTSLEGLPHRGENGVVVPQGLKPCLELREISFTQVSQPVPLHACRLALGHESIGLRNLRIS